MANSGLSGPFALTTVGVDNAVTSKSAGAYMLGKSENNVFKVHYVGRADQDVNGRLKQHVAEWYPEFKCSYFSSPKAAFEKECNLYRDFNPPDNKIHPARPQNSNWGCPRCTVFD